MKLEPNHIYCGDSADILRHFPADSINLIYADPPFFTNKNYEIIWGDGSEIQAYEDRWQGGIEAYIKWIEPKLRQCHRVLASNGSMYLHCDWHANSHLRILMSDIFGENHFQREIIWDINVLSGYKAAANNWIRGHDTLLFYSKNQDFVFNKQFIPQRKEYLELFKKQDENGRYYFTRNHKRRYLDEVTAKGKAIGDVWDDIMSFQQMPMSKEKLGYPTQKPQALLERIIIASSNPTDLVLDPFCGCGTAIAVAQKLGRRWIGIDVSPIACKLMVDRMRALGVDITESSIIKLPRTLDELKSMKPFDFQRWAVEQFDGTPSVTTVADDGIDGWTYSGYPIQVKHSIAGRNVVDNFETALRRKKKQTGNIVALGFSKDAYEEAARARRDGLQIFLLTAEEVLRHYGGGSLDSPNKREPATGGFG